MEKRVEKFREEKTQAFCTNAALRTCLPKISYSGGSPIAKFYVVVLSQNLTTLSCNKIRTCQGNYN